MYRKAVQRRRDVALVLFNKRGSSAWRVENPDRTNRISPFWTSCIVHHVDTLSQERRLREFRAPSCPCLPRTSSRATPLLYHRRKPKTRSEALETLFPAKRATIRGSIVYRRYVQIAQNPGCCRRRACWQKTRAPSGSKKSK